MAKRNSFFLFFFLPSCSLSLFSVARAHSNFVIIKSVCRGSLYLRVVLPAERLNRILLLRQAFCIRLSLSLSPLSFSSCFAGAFFPLARPRSLTFSPVYPMPAEKINALPHRSRFPREKIFLPARVTRRAFPFVFLTLQSAYFHTPPIFLFLFFLPSLCRLPFSSFFSCPSSFFSFFCRFDFLFLNASTGAVIRGYFRAPTGG